MSIVTRTGDRGQTGLFGGRRISKSDARLHAYGTVDELNAVLGVALAEDEIPAQLQKELHSVQRILFTVGADLATPLEKTDRVQRVLAPHIEEVERWIERLEPTLPILTRFILPSGSRTGALLHLARTVCRRAERWVVTLGERERINPQVQVYLNRLSDYLFLAARVASKHAGVREEEV
jgi:cob(I)alamin adenosyltransferase